MQLTQAQCKAIEPGQTLWDTEVTGLHLVRGRRGASWKLAYRTIDGTRRNPKLAAFPSLGLAQAREVARELLQKVAMGGDPSGEWQAAKLAPTVNDLCDRYLRDWLPRKSAESQKQDAHRIATLIRPQLGALKVAHVTTDHLQRFLDGVLHRKWTQARAGTVTALVSANRMRALLWKLFTLAEQWQMRPQGSHPVPGTTKHVEQLRKRHATTVELPKIAEALDHFEPVYGRQIAAIRIMFMTGARVGEIRDVRVKNRVGDTLVFGEGEHKTYRTIGTKVIKLPPQAIEILDRIGPKPDGHYFGREGLRDAWVKIRERAGCPDLQLRDVRRTFASVAKSSGRSLEEVASIFGHTSTQVTRRYAWLYDEAQSTIVNETAESITRLMRGETDGELQPLTKPTG